MSVKSSSLIGWSNNRHKINLPLSHNCWYADTVLWGSFIRWRPHSTQSIPLFARVFDETTSIKCPLEVRLQMSNNLIQWLALNFWPQGPHAAASNAIRNSRSLRWHRDTLHWEEFALGENMNSHKLLNTKQDTRHHFLSDSQPIEFDCEPLPDVSGPGIASAVNWKTSNGTWMSQKQERNYTLPVWRQYKLYTDGAAHENQPVKRKKAGHSLRQGGF